MEFSRWKNIYIILLMSLPLAVGLFFVAKTSDVSLLSPAAVLDVTTPGVNETPAPVVNAPPKLINPPEIIKGIYVTAWSASSKKYLNYLSDLFSATEINAVVVDIKGSDGRTKIYDADKLIKFLHDKNIYVIGRIAVFEDPVYAKVHPELAIFNKVKTTDLTKPVLWQDNNKLSWMDPASKEVWDYNISLAKDAFLRGFDEINFDYVRYPSDGKVSVMGFPISNPKASSQSVIKEFFTYLRGELQGQIISVDLFGQVTTNKDDMGIGQLLEDAFENFDYISPMVYPSHYINGFIGLKNPAKYPYQVVKYSMTGAKIREAVFFDSKKIRTTEADGTPAEESKLGVINADKPASAKASAGQAKFRPWLQDFDMGADYDAEMVKQEIQATKDSLGEDYNGFMLWNPHNIYTFGAILKLK